MDNNFKIKQRILELQYIIYNNYSDVGGELHIVLDDKNIEDEHIQICLKDYISTINDYTERAVYQECAELLLLLSYSSRKRLLFNR